jgi:hypothetical protein
VYKEKDEWKMEYEIMMRRCSMKGMIRGTIEYRRMTRRFSVKTRSGRCSTKRIRGDEGWREDNIGRNRPAGQEKYISLHRRRKRMKKG